MSASPGDSLRTKDWGRLEPRRVDQSLREWPVVRRSTTRLRLAAVFSMLLGGCGFLYHPGIEHWALGSAPGFVLEEVYRVPRDQQGSWVSIAVESDNTLVASSENGRFYRIALAPTGDSEVTVTELDLELGTAHGMVRAFDSLYVVVNAGFLRSGGDNGLYRLRDDDRDGSYESVEKLRAIEGFSEHGPHHLVVGPSGEDLYFVAGNATRPTAFARSRIAVSPQTDQMLPPLSCFSVVEHDPPGGWIARLDPDGEEWELLAAGLRNPYDLAFNRDGELFVFDADMEWDTGLPWYRPTRILHIVSGGEYGWRKASTKWPDWYPDSLGAVANIGTSSPTGIDFAYDTHFPGKYKDALILGDWSHGRIYAAHLEAKGASYTARFEVIASGEPLPVTDLVTLPSDGAMYITTGGRGAHSVLYRLRHTSPEPPGRQRLSHPGPLVELRHNLEMRHHASAATPDEQIWDSLRHHDRNIRFAARVALEHAPVPSWRSQALTLADPEALIQAQIALARVGSIADRDPSLAALFDLEPSSQPSSIQRNWLRAVQLWLIRHGRPQDSLVRELEALLDRMYPASSYAANRITAEVVTFLGMRTALPKTLKLMLNSPTQEEQIHFAYVLSQVREGWSEDDRVRYLSWFERAETYPGGNCYATSLDAIKEQAMSAIPRKDRRRMKRKATKIPPTAVIEEIAPTGPGRTWTVGDAAALVEQPLRGRDFAQGRAMFVATECWTCHRFDGRGGSLGPDLSTVGSRFGAKDLVEAIIEPDCFIPAHYASTEIQLEDKTVIHGQIYDTLPAQIPIYGGGVRVRTDFRTGAVRTLRPGEVAEIRVSTTSMMPSGLVDDLNEDELLDLLAFLIAGGDSSHPVFRTADEHR